MKENEPAQERLNEDTGSTLAATTGSWDGGPAFPCNAAIKSVAKVSETGTPILEHHMQHHVGMTLRDWFAGQALQGMLASEVDGGGPREVAIAADAYKYADAMIRHHALRSGATDAVLEAGRQ